MFELVIDVNNYLTIKVLEDDNLPAQVCVKCFHQIAKFYTFRKKVERSDRILKNYIKQHKLKTKPKELSDILDIAVNDAEIQESQSDGSISDDDIPLIQRIREENRKMSAKSKSKIYKLAEKEEEKELSDEGDSRVDTNESNTSIFSDGPPPLIPLKKDEKEPIAATVIRNLPENTPPLIPIKPFTAVNSETILSALSTLTVESNIKLKCSFCSKEFSTITELKQHKKLSCKSSGLQCNICKKEFKERKRLIGHLKGHMVAKKYRCNVCGKSYPNPSTFRVHMRTHTGERPFKCQICNKGFVRWAGVVGHMKTHTSVKPYICNTCGKGYVEITIFYSYALSHYTFGTFTVCS